MSFLMEMSLFYEYIIQSPTRTFIISILVEHSASEVSVLDLDSVLFWSPFSL